MSRVTSNDAVSYRYLADLFGDLSIDVEVFNCDITIAMCSIAINSTKGEINTCVASKTRTSDEDAAATLRRIIRDSAVVQRERAAIVVDAATVILRCIIRDSAVVQGDRAAISEEGSVDEGSGLFAALECETVNGSSCSLYYMNCVTTLASTDREHTCTRATDRQVLRDVQITTSQRNGSMQTRVKRNGAS